MTKKKLFILSAMMLGFLSFAGNANFSAQSKLKKKMKLKGDSLIVAIYGKAFFKDAVTWSKENSYVYSGPEAGNWSDKLSGLPDKFLLRYNVKLDKVIYDRLIEFSLDAQGNFIPNKYEPVYGFENIGPGIEKVFKLTVDNALKKSKALGLTDSAGSPVKWFLKWENFKQEQLYCGQFRFYIIQKAGSEKTPDSTDENYTQINYFEVYSFSPWTGDFIEKKKMKQYFHRERNSGSSSGLMECK